MAIPRTREELTDYCLRNLGAPVITINVAQEQLEDRVDEAIQFYQEYHSDAVVKHYRKHTIDETDIENRYISLPENILFLSDILPYTTSSRNMFSIEWRVQMDNMYDLMNPGSSIISYEMYKQFQELLYRKFDPSFAQTTRFSRHKNRVYVDLDWERDVKEGDILVFECYSTINPDEYVSVYNDLFLKRYLTALIKRNWGANTKKFSGMTLPGGVDINGQNIFDEAQQEIREMEEEMASRYEMPPMGFIG